MYTKEALKDIAEKTKKKILAKLATEEESLIGMVASHTVDFLNLAEDNNIPLSLSDQTEENVPKAMILLHKYNINRNLSVSESRKDLVEKVGGYELFSLLNGFEDSGVKVETTVVSNRLILEHQKPDGKVIRFDVLGEMEKTMNSFKLSSDEGPFILMGTLQPFYQVLVNDFLRHIMII